MQQHACYNNEKVSAVLTERQDYIIMLLVAAKNKAARKADELHE